MRDKPDSPNSRAWWIVAGLSALALVLRAIHLTRFSFWADECLTMFVAQMPLGEVIRIVLLTDVHPPLYYVLLHLWQAVSHNEIYLRSLSLIPGVVAVPAVYLLARRLVSGRAALIAAALIAVNPLHAVQSQQLRYPALFTLLSVLAIYFFHRTLYRPKTATAVAYAAVSVAIVYTNYVGLGLLVFAAVWLAIERKGRPAGWKAAVVAWIAACLCFALWLPILLIQSQRLPHGTLFPPAKIALYTLLDFTYGIGFWGMPRAGSRDAELVLLGLADRPWLLAASLVPFAVLFAVGLLRREEGRRFTFDRAYLAVVLGFGWIVCATSNVFQAKYVLIALPAFAIVTAAGIDRVLTRAKVAGAVAVLAVYIPLTAFGLGTYWSKEMIYEEHYRELARFLAKHKQPGDAILMFHAIAEACVSYYVAGELNDVFIAPRNDDNDQMNPERLLEQFTEIEAHYDRVWVVSYYAGHRDPGGFARDWFDRAGQFRQIDSGAPKKLRDVVELYEVVFKPAPEPSPADAGP